MRLGYLVIIVAIFFTIISLLPTAEAKTWTDQECFSYCGAHSWSYVFCSKDNCPEPQCKYEPGFILFKKSNYCVSSKMDDGEEAYAHKMCGDKDNTKATTNAIFFCSKEADAKGKLVESVKMCKWDEKKGIWTLTEVKCPNHCNGDVCKDECEHPNFESKCEYDTIVQCQSYCPQRQSSCITPQEPSWKRWEFPNEVLGSVLKFYCEGGCESYTEEGVKKARCRETCNPGESRCFSLDLRDLSESGHMRALSQEKRFCGVNLETGNKEFVRNEKTELCPFGCENTVERYEEGDKKGEIKSSEAKCKQTESYSCDQLCKEDSKRIGDLLNPIRGWEYEDYAHGMCIPDDAAKKGCEIFGDFAYRPASDKTKNVCDIHDFYVIKASDNTKTEDMLFKMKASKIDISYNIYLCTDLLVKNSVKCDDFKVLFPTTEDIYIVDVGGPERKKVVDAMYESAKWAFHLGGDNYAPVYEDYATQFESGKVCCCSSPYRTLASGPLNIPAGLKQKPGEVEYAAGEPLPKKDSSNNYISCELACWRKYNKQLTLSEVYDNLVMPDRYSTARGFFRQEVGACVSVGMNKIKTSWKESDPFPDVCGEGFVPAVSQGGEFLKPFSYNLIEGAGRAMYDSPHCKDTGDNNLDACCCRIYVLTPEAQAVITYMNEYKKFLEHVRAEKEKEKEFKDKVDKVNNAMGSLKFYSGFQNDAFVVYITRRKIQERMDMVDRIVQQVNRNPYSVVSVLEPLASMKRLNIYFDDGKSYATLLINLPALQADWVNGASSATFSVGGAFFDKNYFFGVNLKMAQLVTVGKECYYEKTVEDTQLTWANDAAPYFLGVDETGQPLTNFNSDGFQNFGEFQAITSNTNNLFAVHGDTLLPSWGSGQTVSNIDQKLRDQVAIEIDNIGSSSAGGHTYTFHKTHIKYPINVVSSQLVNEKRPCPGPGYGVEQGIVIGNAVAYAINDVFNIKGATLIPMLRTEVMVNGEAKLALDTIFTKTSKDGLEKFDIKIYGSTSMKTTKEVGEDKAKASMLGGIAFSYKKLNQPQGVPEMWYDAHLLDPVEQKYREQVGGNWQQFILPYMGTGEQLSSNVDAIRKLAQKRISAGMTKEEFYGGAFVKTSGDGESTDLLFDKVAIGYLGVQKKLDVLKKTFDYVKLNTYLAAEIPFAASKGESLAADDQTDKKNPEGQLSFTLHGSIQGFFKGGAGSVNLWTDIQIPSLAESKVGFDIISVRGNDWAFRISLVTPLTDFGKLGFSMVLDKKILWGLIDRVGVGVVDGKLNLLINSNIPLGYLTVINKAYQHLSEATRYLLRYVLPSKETVPSSHFGVPFATDKTAVWNFPGGSARPIVDKFTANFDPYIAVIVAKTKTSKFVEKRACALGCQVLADGRAGCVEELKPSGELTTEKKMCSNNGMDIQSLVWPAVYPYEPEFTICTYGCRDGQCIKLPCVDGKKMCSPDKWNLMTCIGGKFQVSECEFGCMQVSSSATCKSVSCEDDSKCELGNKRCNGYDVQECVVNEETNEREYRKIKECSLGCDSMNVQGRYACFEDNSVLQNRCAKAEKSGNSIWRCAADGIKQETCVEKEYRDMPSKKGFVYGEHPIIKAADCEYGCSGDKCLSAKDAQAGLTFCSTDRKNVLEYKPVGGKVRLVPTACAAGKECSFLLSYALMDGSGRFAEGTMRCSDDGDYVMKYSSGLWKVEGRKCAYGCDPIENKCREEVKCTAESMRCSADGMSVEKCTNPMTGMTTDANGQCAYGCEYKNGDAQCPEAGIDDITVPRCSPDGMYRIDIPVTRPPDMESNRNVVKELCDFGCDPKTATCRTAGCVVGSETCISGDIYKCEETWVDNKIIPAFGNNVLTLKLTLRNLYGSPSTVAVICGDYRHGMPVSPPSSYLTHIGEGILNKGVTLQKDIEMKLIEGKEGPLLYEELREVRCLIYLFSDLSNEAPTIVKDDSPKLDEITSEGTFDLKKVQYYFNNKGMGMPSRTIVVSGISVRVTPAGEKPLAVFNLDYCKKKKSLSEEKCGWGEGDCDSALGQDECDKGLECKSDKSVGLFDIGIWKTIDICCKPWQKVACAEKEADGKCKTPICVPDPAYVNPGSQNYCKWKIEEKHVKCGLDEGNCDNTEQCEDGLKCTLSVIGPERLWNTIFTENGPSLCCRPGEVVIETSEIIPDAGKLGLSQWRCWPTKKP